MERIEVLIDKLVVQKQDGSTPVQMLMTVHLLQNELLAMQQSATQSGSKKVSVIMPTNNAAAVNVPESKTHDTEASVPKIQVTKPAPVKQMQMTMEEEQPMQMKEQPAAVKEEIVVSTAPEPIPEKQKPVVVKQEQPKPVESIKAEIKEEHKPYIPEVKEEPQARPIMPEVKKEQPATSEPYYLRRPVLEEVPKKEDIKELHPKVEQPAPHFPFDAMAETPTLLQQQPPPSPKEVHELIGERKESLNDRLKQEKKEVVHQLKDTPVKDLRKAIGINDKFLFVNELFRGDEGMYERSIKTINNFHILPEAEYWMNRELKVKLGWNDSKDTVQHFYSLVRRRFS